LGRPVRVVGVAANLKYAKLDADPEMFRLYSQNLSGGNTTMMVAVRMTADPLGFAPSLDKRIAGIDRAEPVYDVQSLEQALVTCVSARRFDLFLLGIFAAVALIMATVGVYAVIAYSVTERTREIGIRMTLGAQRNEVLRMVIAQAMWIGFCGLAVGLGAASGLMHFMTNLLYGVMPDDPATFAAAAIALGGTVLLASCGPAFKSALLDPLVALRHEERRHRGDPTNLRTSLLSRRVQERTSCLKALVECCSRPTHSDLQTLCCFQWHEIAKPDSEHLDHSTVFQGSVGVAGQLQASTPSAFFEVQVAELLFHEPEGVRTKHC
jgi:hypothetical protein